MMLWFLRHTTPKTETHDVVPTSTPRAKPRPYAVAVDAEDNTLAEYEQVAGALDFAPAALWDGLMRRFLLQQEIPVFRYNEVRDYLVAKAKQEVGQTWYWRTLRKRDEPLNFQFGGDDAGYYRASAWECRPYDRAIPLRALRHVMLIQQAFPDALFFVTDYGAPNPDPFIAVRGPMPDSRLQIFDVWDEPGFTDRPGYEGLRAGA